MYSWLHHKAKIYRKPKELLADAIGYFEWCVDHPLKEDMVYMYRGEIIRTHVDKVRAFTLKGLASHLGMTVSTFNRLKLKDDEWSRVVELIEQVIYTQKFENAAAGLLNTTIISRDLGLAEKSEVAGITGAPPITFSISPIAAGTFMPPTDLPES